MAIWRSRELWLSHNSGQPATGNQSKNKEAGSKQFEEDDQIAVFPDRFPEPFDWQPLQQTKKAKSGRN